MTSSHRQSPAPAARLELVNAFRLTAQGKVVSLPIPSQRLLSFLALHSRPMLRSYVAESLWLDSTGKRASGNLRSALWHIRRPRCELIEVGNHQIWLAPEVVVDVREAIAWAKQLMAGSIEAEDYELDGLAIGDLLPDWYDDWVLIERERFRELRVRALEYLCARFADHGRFGHAIEAGLAAVEGDPLRESAHRSVIRVHLAEGNPAEAVGQYRLYRKLLKDRLGLEPSRQIKQLMLNLTSC